MLEHLRDLFGHMEWADAVWFHTWEATDLKDDEDLRRRLAHMALVQTGFLDVVRGAPLELPAETPVPGLETLKAWIQGNHEAYARLLDHLGSEDLTRRMRIPWFPDPPCLVTVGEALTQAVMHTQHHRGQLMTRLKDLGGKARNVDYIIWVRHGRPGGLWN